MSSPLIIMLFLFILFMATRIPLSFAMILSAALYMLLVDKPLDMVAHLMFNGINTFTLLAIPFFVLASELMVMSGTAEKLLDFANMLVGGFRGGLAYVNVLASMMFGGCSGSAIADVAGLGRLEIELMEKGGYEKPFSTAITVSSSIQGPLIPPSIPMVLIGAVTGSSVGALLVGGAIPGVLVGVSQCVVIWYYGKKRGFPVNPVKMSASAKLKLCIQSIPFILMPLIIVGGIISGWFTPTEASGVAVCYGFLLTIIYKAGRVPTLSLLKDLRGVFSRSVLTAASILLLSGASNVFGWILTTERVPVLISDTLTSMTDNKYLVLMLVNIFLLIWGMVMDSLPAITIILPILFPLAQNLGIDPIHFGIIVVLNLVLGLTTPPVGVCLFVTSSIGKISLYEASKGVMPFLLGNLVILALVTYVPFLTLGLVNLLF